MAGTAPRPRRAAAGGDGGAAAPLSARVLPAPDWPADTDARAKGKGAGLARWGRGLAGALAIAALSACMARPSAPPSHPAPAATPRPLAAPEALGRAAQIRDPDHLSAVMRLYYAGVQRDLLRQGRMRTDVAPADAPVTRDLLVRDFVDVALYDEYAHEHDGFVQSKTASPLRRWEVPVRMRVEYGASVPQGQRRQDSAAIRAYAGQLSRAARHPVALVHGDANFTIFIVAEAERQALGPRLEQMVPGISRSTVAAITGLSPSTLCAVFAFSPQGGPAYGQAVAVIRAELPAAMTRSCIDEELAQGMGLANDSPEARPSVFNDDEEFARLTRHDELLLAMLYDPRLRPGMTAAEAQPILPGIAAQLLGTPVGHGT